MKADLTWQGMRCNCNGGDVSVMAVACILVKDIWCYRCFSWWYIAGDSDIEIIVVL